MKKIISALSRKIINRIYNYLEKLRYGHAAYEMVRYEKLTILCQH